MKRKTRTDRRLDAVFEAAERLSFDDSSRIVLMSDCHRGDGSWADNFARNQALYNAALERYTAEGYTYIELGDGDELWENTSMQTILSMHRHVFLSLARLYQQKRFYMLFGNHDMLKNGTDFAACLSECPDDCQCCCHPLFPGLRIHEGLVLQHQPSGGELLLVHGHQADFFNDRLWRVGRLLVHRLWKPLELMGVHDPTSAAKNYRRKDRVERHLTNWVREKPLLLVAGHTHRPSFPKPGEAGYFNDGSAVHPGSVTALEISSGILRLVKWVYKTRMDGVLFAGRETIGGPEPLASYFSSVSSAISEENTEKI